MIGLVVVIKVCCGIPPEREIRFRVQFLRLCGLGGCGGGGVAVCVLRRCVLLGRGGGVLLRICLGGGAVFVGYRVSRNLLGCAIRGAFAGLLPGDCGFVLLDLRRSIAHVGAAAVRILFARRKG